MRRDGLNIALLTYRGNPHSGGQGVYARYLSDALVKEGHRVTVFSGPPYPELDDGVTLERVPSLDLYNQDDPFRRPRRDELRDWVNVLEYALMCAAAFPEPLTFSLRAARLLRNRPHDFDVVHDNQSLGYGLLALSQPVVATVHHPCSVDHMVELQHATSGRRRLSLRRWYSFTRMQGRVARRLRAIIAVSASARADVIRDFGTDPRRVAVVHNGVDTELFKPLPHVGKVAGRIVTTASADVPLKGLVHLIEALAKLRTERAAELVVVGRASARGPVTQAIERFGLQDAVRFECGIERLRLVELYAEAQVAVVPSLYEGFSLPAVEAMASGVPLVATRAGALPEVVGGDGEAALLVPPADPGALASGIGRLLDDPVLGARLGAAGRRRAAERFTWRAAARTTVDQYRQAIERC
ncbi:MAG: glycosyltransferase family 4 protein [Actinomycetota bacterium]